jgi:hypothetical protein
VKNFNKEKSGRKDFLDHWLAEKGCAFSRQGMLRKMNGKEAIKGKKGKKG